MQKRNHSKKSRKRPFRINEKQDREKVQKKKILNRITIELKDDALFNAIEFYNEDKTNKINNNTNPDTLVRILLNYIRHNLTNYDTVIHPLSKTDFNLFAFKRKVNEMITEKYIDVFIKIEMRKL